MRQPLMSHFGGEAAGKLHEVLIEIIEKNKGNFQIRFRV
jgi:hypothetical protein